MIKTDGIAVSILFIRTDENNIHYKYNLCQTQGEEKIKYIENETLQKLNKENLLSKR